MRLLKRERADKPTAAALERAPGSAVFHSLVVHFENGVPVQVEDRHANPDFAPGYLDQDFSAITPYVYLTALGPLDAAEHVIEAVRPDAETQRLLAIGPEDPAGFSRGAPGPTGWWCPGRGSRTPARAIASAAGSPRAGRARQIPGDGAMNDTPPKDTEEPRLDNEREDPQPRAAREISCKSWLTEAPLRMLMNNLDAEVAEKPQELVVYGGIGRAARDWAVLRPHRRPC